MKTKIAIVGNGEFIDLAERSIGKLNVYGVEVKVFDCSGDVSVTIPNILTILEEIETDIIITGHFIKISLEKRTTIPVIKLKVTPIDILLALHKIIPYSNHIAIALSNLGELKYDYSILEELSNVKIHYINYSTHAELREKIKNFSTMGGTIISTGIGVNFAKEFGLQGTLIYSESSIIATVERALEIIHFKRREDQQGKQLRAVIDSVSDGIIATDEQDKITFFNEAAWKLLNMKKNNISGERLLKVIPDHSIREMMRHEAFENKIIKINQSTLNTSKVPISHKGIKSGNIFTLQDISEIQKIEQKYRVEIESKGLIAKSEFKDIIYESEIMQGTIDKAIKYAKTDSTVLITGESGTGKEIIAQSIHNQSYRSSYPFVAINCAALPETLLESELFGYEKGAFTGATNEKKGLFELAHHGTIFFDEINSISPHFQARLLRAIQEKEVVRVGGTRVIPVNIRILAAANEDLVNLVKEQKFRADLYYRLNVLKINLPPLRDRADDIITLAKNYISQQRKILYNQIEHHMEEVCESLLNYSFPGNVRELYNILERFIILAETDITDINYYRHHMNECIEDIKVPMASSNQLIEVSLKDNYKDSLAEAERCILKSFLDMRKGNRQALADELEIGRTTLYRRLKELGIT